MILESRPKRDEEKAVKMAGREYLSQGEHRECEGPEVQVGLLWPGPAGGRCGWSKGRGSRGQVRDIT